jgi:peptidoglycan/xylan/chitin deacetylase (PgdA/CDA1 family)
METNLDKLFDQLARECGYEPAWSRPPLGWYNRYDGFDHVEFARKVWARAWAEAVNNTLDS